MREAKEERWRRLQICSRRWCLWPLRISSGDSKGGGGCLNLRMFSRGCNRASGHCRRHSQLNMEHPTPLTGPQKAEGTRIWSRALSSVPEGYIPDNNFPIRSFGSLADSNKKDTGARGLRSPAASAPNTTEARSRDAPSQMLGSGGDVSPHSPRFGSDTAVSPPDPICWAWTWTSSLPNIAPAAPGGPLSRCCRLYPSGSGGDGQIDR